MTQQRSSIDQRERVRKSFDKIRVNNPFDKDYSTIWDGFHHIVRARSFAILERFLAEKWLREQCKRIVTEEADSAIKAENERRKHNNQLPMDKTRKTGEQLEFEAPYYANWESRFPELIKKYNLYGGIIQEYGMEYVPQSINQNTEIAGSLIEQLETPQNTPMVAPEHEGGKLESIIDNLESKGVFELRKIAKGKGLAVQKTDKKSDLIKAITA